MKASFYLKIAILYLQQYESVYGTEIEKYENLADIILGINEINKSLETLQMDVNALEISKKNTLGNVVSPEIESKFSDCASLYDDGYTESGVYNIWLTTGYRFLPIYCDMETRHHRTNKRGWMVIQRRYNGELNFNRTWQEYVDGFGSPNGEYWIGLENIYQLAKYTMKLFDGRSLMINLADKSITNIEVVYEAFEILNSIESYMLVKPLMARLDVPLQDGLATSQREKFSTYDKNNQKSQEFGNCALNSGGGWWLDFGCSWSNLNARYPQKNEKMSKSTIYWEDWNEINSNNDALTNVSMKLH